MVEQWKLEYLEHLEAALGKRLSAIAEMADIASTTLTRPVNDRSHKYTLKETTLDKVAKATGIPYDNFKARYFGAATFVHPASTISKPESSKGFAEPGIAPWKARTPGGYKIDKPLPNSPYQTGTILIVDLNGKPKPGDEIIANKLDFENDSAETLIGRFAPPYIIPFGNEANPEVIDGDVRIVGPIVSFFKEPAL